MRSMKAKRSPAMQKVVHRLEAMKRSLSWLGGELVPPVRRQTVSGYTDIPDHYVSQVAELTGLTTEQIRPDLAAHFKTCPKKKAA